MLESQIKYAHALRPTNWLEGAERVLVGQVQWLHGPGCAPGGTRRVSWVVHIALYI
jgi:hypothetical protein